MIERCAIAGDAPGEMSGWRASARHGEWARMDVLTTDEATARRLAHAWAASIVSDKDTRADIDKLGDAVGIDTRGGKKADALKALRSGR